MMKLTSLMRATVVAFTTFFLSCIQQANAEFVVTYNSAESGGVFSNLALIQLALEKTRPAYGDYVLKPSVYLALGDRPAYLQRNHIPNLVAAMGIDSERDARYQLDYVPFPTDLGLLGMRICFVSSELKSKVAAAKTLEELKQFSIVQGENWIDNKILKANGFRVIEVEPRGPNLLQMVASGRADLFCRGISELKVEWEKYNQIPHLDYDESFVLSYKMPIFFYLNKNNQLLKRRLQEGLALAFRDGSIQKLWYQENEATLAFGKLKNRRLFLLNSQLDPGIDKEYEKYLINPFVLKK